MAGSAGLVNPRGTARGFSLVEVLAAVAVLGIVSLGAVRLYTATFGVHNKLAGDFDLRQNGLRILDEIRGGFALEGAAYTGVFGASEVGVTMSGKRLNLTVGDKPVSYNWDEGSETLVRTVGEDSSIVLEGVRQFRASCSDSDKLVLVHLELEGRGSPRPNVKLDASLRPRITTPVCE